MVEKENGKKVHLAAKRWHVLEIMAKANGWQTYVELGVYKGWTLLHMLKHCPELRVIGVDAYAQPFGRNAEVYPDDMEQVFKRMSDALLPYGSRAQLLRMDTREAARMHFAQRFNVVFVDADHRTENAAADISAWKPLIAPGGWLMGHDWHMESVRAAVTATLPKPTLFPDNVWGVRC